MQFTQETIPSGTVLSLQGAFTFRDHHAFRSLLDVLKAAPGRSRVLDLSQLEFLDSAALGMLLVADEEGRRAGWTLTLRRPPARIAQLLELAVFDALMTTEK